MQVAMTGNSELHELHLEGVQFYSEDSGKILKSFHQKSDTFKVQLFSYIHTVIIFPFFQVFKFTFTNVIFIL